jgi:hypothetical protein
MVISGGGTEAPDGIEILLASCFEAAAFAVDETSYHGAR